MAMKREAGASETSCPDYSRAAPATVIELRYTNTTVSTRLQIQYPATIWEGVYPDNSPLVSPETGLKATVMLRAGGKVRATWFIPTPS